MNTTGTLIALKEGYFEWHIENFVGEIWCSQNGLKSPVLSFLGDCFYILLHKSPDLRLILVSLYRYNNSSLPDVSIGGIPKLRIVIDAMDLITYKNNTIALGVWKFRDYISEDWDPMYNARLQLYLRFEKNHQRERFLNKEVQEDRKTDSDEKENESSYQNEEVQEKNKDCETDSDEEENESNYQTLKKLQRDMKNLFKNREDCDITLKVQTKEFPAHRNILWARSPVFKSMFSHDMEENRTRVVDIQDSDPSTFPDFLKYLYSGSTKHISEENVYQLYTVSDKYQVEELKQECTDFMIRHLSVETFCDFLTLGFKYTEKELIDLASNFFCDNSIEIVKTVKWQTFLQSNSTVGNELFLKALSRGKNV